VLPPCREAAISDRTPGTGQFRNAILSALPVGELERVGSSISRVSLVTHQVLHERGARIEDVFFIEAGLASLTADTADEGQVEVGLTGWEGMVGISAILNPDATAAHRAFIQVPGAACRMSAAALRAAVGQSPALRDRCLRYVQFLLVQTAQTAACNARHTLPARLARWLLMTHDRGDSDDLPLTQEFLSLMLGVRRAGVSVTVSTLEAANLIRQGRGSVAILDRAGLEAACCNCYGFLRKSQWDILGSDTVRNCTMGSTV
jgi:CRP-like cAMP-binding protein